MRLNEREAEYYKSADASTCCVTMHRRGLAVALWLLTVGAARGVCDYAR